MGRSSFVKQCHRMIFWAKWLLEMLMLFGLVWQYSWPLACLEGPLVCWAWESLRSYWPCKVSLRVSNNSLLKSLLSYWHTCQYVTSERKTKSWFFLKCLSHLQSRSVATFLKISGSWLGHHHWCHRSELSAATKWPWELKILLWTLWRNCLSNCHPLSCSLWRHTQ